MSSQTYNLQALLVDLDRKVSRAMENRRGITLSPDQLDALASIGMVEKLACAKAEILVENARCRQTRAISTNAAGSGSALIEVLVVSPLAPDGTFGGTTPPPGTSGARARARVMFG